MFGAAVAAGSIGACQPGGSGTGSSDSEPASWRERVIGDEPSEPASTDALAALELANAALESHRDIWALNHYDDDGDGVVVNLTAGWEAVLGDEVDNLIATAPAAVEVREVEHSYDELMVPAIDSTLSEADYAGASVVGVFVDPERNALVVELTEIDQDSITAAADAFGSDAKFRPGTQASPARG